MPVLITKNSCISLWHEKGPARSGVYPVWLSDGRDASALIERSETERIVDKALERIIGEVFPENLASVRVLDKNSFRLGGDEGRRHCERRKSDRREGVRTSSLSLFRYQFVTCAADVDDADAGVFGECAAQAGDEDLEAAGVEEVVVAPEVEEEVLHGNDFSVGTAEAAEDFGFTVGEVDGLAFREVFQRLG